MVVSVVIPFYNGDAWIRACVESTLKSQPPVSAVFIVNNSTQPTEIRQFFPDESRVRIIAARPGIGFGRASNLGAFRAIETGCDVVIVLNQDATVFPDTIGRLVEPFNADPQIAICTPLVCEYDAAEPRLDPVYVGMYVARQPDLISDAVLGRPLRPFYTIRQAMSGACVAVRAGLILQLGLFEPLIKMYGEDVDLYTRFTGHGYTAVLVPSAQIAHRHGHGQARGAERRNIKRRIHRNTPYAIWNAPGPTAAARLKNLLDFLLKNYFSALAKTDWRLFLSYCREDLSLPFRLFRAARHRDTDRLLIDLRKQIAADRLTP